MSEDSADIKNVVYVGGNASKLDAARAALDALKCKTNAPVIGNLEIGQDYESYLVAVPDHTRAYVKIEDGCENKCAYCIIPKVRGPVRSKAPADVICEVKGLARLGYKEIVLTGIETCSYQYGLADLIDELSKSRELEEQYEWISEFIELKMQHTDFELTGASVCGRESGNYSSVFMLDAGTSAGISKNMTVVTGDGILGYIADVGPNWSKAVSVLESSSAVGVYSERSGVTGVLEGDFSLALEGLCRISYLEEGADIEVGDRIMTGGYGSVYPRGIMVGYVERIEQNEFSRSLTAYVRPSAFADGEHNISKVMIITDYETTTE